MLKKREALVFVKHRRIERFFVVTILKFSLFSACKSVHRVERFKQLVEFDLFRIRLFFFFDDFRKEIELEKNEKVFVFAKL